MAQPELTPQQHDLLYGSIVARLTGIDDVYFAFQNGDFSTAQRLSGEFSDDLRVLHDDLLWDGTPSENIQMRAPRDVWERTLTRARQRAEADAHRFVQAATEVDEERSRIHEMETACENLAAQLSSSE